MGMATRWLKGMLGMKKDKEKERENFDTSSSVSSEKKEKKRWSFGKSGKEAYVIPPVNVPSNVKHGGRIRSYIVEREIEQNKHAIAVAAATAAAADAAVAAAQAAAAVVRLTSRGKGTVFGSGRERLAAVKIQAVFRGYLARKARRALKGLVKLQALLRGYLVRKRAAATLHSMQALIRAQTNLRSQRARPSINKDNRHPEVRARRSTEKCEDVRSEYHSKRLSCEICSVNETPKIVEIDTYKPLSRSQATGSPIPCPNPARITIPECKNHPDFDWYITGEEPKFSTAQSTPRFANSIRYDVPVTPAKSVCGDSYFRPYSNFPNYMANTQSFKAKLRSHSAPKQRPEPLPRKRISLYEMMASRNSISSITSECRDQSTKLMKS